MEYVQLKKVHLFFYSKDSSNKYNYLLYKNVKEDLYHHIYNDITYYDNGSIYSISRFLTKNFSIILTDDFISKLQKKEQFEVKNENKNLKQYQLWENETFTFWLDKLSKNPIQYDAINEEVIYFIEIPNLSIESLNSILDKSSFEYRFEYINDKNYSSFKLFDETLKLFGLLSLAKISRHINDTLKIKEDKAYSLYIILSLKTPGKDQNGIFHFPALF